MQPTENPAAEQSAIHIVSHNIIAYLSQIIVNVHNDFALGYKLCIVHFSAKRLSFRDSKAPFTLHVGPGKLPENCRSAFCVNANTSRD